MTNTALSAMSSEITQKVTFSGQKHKDFYLEYLLKCRYQDVYHEALVLLQRMALPFYGISEDTRRNAERIYDFQSGCVKTECLQEGWITSGSARIIRLAFNLYCNGTPSVSDYENDAEKALNESREYSVKEVFCCTYAPYFWEAVKIRYPEYCDR